MRFIIHTFAFILSLTLLSCESEGKRFFVGCCDNDPILDSFGNTTIYVPNIFTPNGDGINDLFLIHGSSIREIHSLKIRNHRGQQVFEGSDFLSGNVSPEWDGRVDGVVEKGLYSFTLVVEAEDATIRQFEGSVCNYPCGLLEGEEVISITHCRFSTQDPQNLLHIEHLQYPDYPGCFK
jgi:gliding motility-associated-like protein